MWIHDTLVNDVVNDMRGLWPLLSVLCFHILSLDPLSHGTVTGAER